MNILDCMWFGNVGIVRAGTDYGEVRYYIKQVEGRNEEIDKRDIADWGCSFPKDAGDILFGVASCLSYEGMLLYGNSESLSFVSELIREREMNADRRSANLLK